MKIFSGAKIDSLLISIPIYSDIDNLKQLLMINRQPYVLMDMESGSIIDDFKHRAIKQKFNNFEFYYQYEIFKNPKTRLEKHSLNLLLSSKLNGIDYFSGVTKNLVYNVIQHLIDINIIGLNEISIDKLLNLSNIKDLDICTDYMFERTDIIGIYEGYKLISEQFKLSKKLNKGISIYPKLKKNNDIEVIKLKNLGLVINVRKGSTVNVPHVKNYSKSHDLIYSKVDLFNSLDEVTKYYLTEYLIIRHELTLLNSKFFKHFNLSQKFSFWFNLDKAQMTEIFKKVNSEYSNNIFEKKTIIKNTDEIKPTDLVLLRLMEIIDNSIDKTDNRFINLLKLILNKNKIDLSNNYKTDILYYILLEVFTDGFDGSQKTRQTHKLNELFAIKKYFSNEKFRLKHENINAVKFRAFDMFELKL